MSSSSSNKGSNVSSISKGDIENTTTSEASGDITNNKMRGGYIAAIVIGVVIIIIIIILAGVYGTSNTQPNNNQLLVITNKQTTPAMNIVGYSAILDGNQEVPSVTTKSGGLLYASLFNNNLAYDVTIDNLSSSVITAGFYLGSSITSSSNGNLLASITLDQIPNTNSWRTIGVWDNLSTSDVSNLSNGNIYINISTQKNPSGEIRGSLASS